MLKVITKVIITDNFDAKNRVIQQLQIKSQ